MADVNTAWYNWIREQKNEFTIKDMQAAFPCASAKSIRAWLAAHRIGSNVSKYAYVMRVGHGAYKTLDDCIISPGIKPVNKLGFYVKYPDLREALKNIENPITVNKLHRKCPQVPFDYVQRWVYRKSISRHRKPKKNREVLLYRMGKGVYRKIEPQDLVKSNKKEINMANTNQIKEMQRANNSDLQTAYELLGKEIQSQAQYIESLEIMVGELKDKIRRLENDKATEDVSFANKLRMVAKLIEEQK